MKRREFLGVGFGVLALRAVLPESLWAQDKKAAKPAEKAAGASTLTEKDILREGQPATIANYCEKPEKQPNKFCPSWKEGKCNTCQFYNQDKSETAYKGGKYARCMLLTDPSKPRFVAEGAWCATYVKKA